MRALLLVLILTLGACARQSVTLPTAWARADGRPVNSALLDIDSLDCKDEMQKPDGAVRGNTDKATDMPLLKELYRRLRPHAAWTEIDSDFGGKVRASLNFTVGDGHNIQFLFSSGQRRAAGLAFLLAIHLSRRWCSWESLLLDDPVQHIDDYRALNLVEVLAAIRRSGRQVIVAVEDPALADLLCRRLRSTIVEFGRRFDLQTSKNGSAEIASARDISPMPRAVLRPAQAS
jgi:chromosome segregation protein